jgi:tetratricopeptide (TPR) repeat protein
MNEPDRGSSFFRELSRRRVFRAAATYIVVAWVAIQAGSIVFPEFGAPGWAMRALIIVLIVGFPPTMLLAWTLDFSGKGLTRTPDSRYTRTRGIWPKLAIVLTATAMSAGMLWWVWDDYIVQSRQRPARSDIRAQPVVAVQEPRHLTGRSENDWLGDGIANLIRSELAESQHVIVISRARWKAMTSDIASGGEISARARSIGVDYLIDGELFETPDGIVLTTHIEDLENGVEILSPRTSGDSVSSILESVVHLSTEIKRALRIPHQERVGRFEADFAIENVEAYEAYIAGLAYFTDFEYQEAERAFNTALEIAPDYHIARFRLALVYESTGRSELARTTLDEIPPDANLSKRLQLYVDGAKAYFIAQRDPRKAIEIYTELVKLYPYETEAGSLLAEAYWTDFQDAAAIREYRRLSEIHPYDPTSWMALGERLLDVGELDEAREALDRFASMEPGNAHAFALLGNLASLQGDLDTSIERHEHALALRPGFVVAMLGLARSQYLRGNVTAAESLWRSIIADDDIAADDRIDAAFDLAGVLRGRGLYAESLAPTADTMALIREEGLRTAMALSEQGSTFLEMGDAERAEALIDDAIRQAPAPATRYLFARGMMELRLGRFEELDRTIAAIRLLSDNDDTDRTEDKAANYLAGLSALEKGDLDAAASLLQAAVDEAGYQYAIYRSGLAMLYRAAGDLQTASTLAIRAATERDPGDLRLDLELHRARTLLLYAEILEQNNAESEAREQAQRFVDWWHGADDKLPELIRARALLAGQ